MMETLKGYFEKVKSDKNRQKEIKTLSEINGEGGLICFAKVKSVSDKDMNQIKTKEELADEELAGVAGGAFPTTVNGQITD